MTDRNEVANHEKLIEEAAKAIWEESITPGRKDRWEDEPGYAVDEYETQARAALAVFEKAHTPTDDEVNALTKQFADRIFTAGLRAPESTLSVIVFKEIAAGFHRSEVPGPSAEVDDPGGRLFRSRTYKALAERDFTGHMDEGRRTAFYEGWNARVQWEALRAGPQAEPSSEVPEPSAALSAIERAKAFLTDVSETNEMRNRNAYGALKSIATEAQGEPSDPPQRLVHEVNMLLSSVASHGPSALTDTSDRMYTPGLLRRLRDALDPTPAQRLAAGNAVRAEMARNGLDVHPMVYGQEIANVIAGAALDGARRAAGGVR